MQICINPIGYNYLVFYVIILATVFFDDIKTLSVGIFKLEKYEKLADYIDEAIITMYEATLNYFFNFKSSTWSEKIICIERFDDIKNIIENIERLPVAIKEKLNNHVKNVANNGAQRQKDLLNGQDKFFSTYQPGVILDKPTDLVEDIRVQDLPQEVNQSEEITKAKKIYKYLYDLSENGIL